MHDSLDLQGNFSGYHLVQRGFFGGTNLYECRCHATGAQLVMVFIAQVSYIAFVSAYGGIPRTALIVPRAPSVIILNGFPSGGYLRHAALRRSHGQVVNSNSGGV
jgi:hypothetical protein